MRSKSRTAATNPRLTVPIRYFRVTALTFSLHIGGVVTQQNPFDALWRCVYRLPLHYFTLSKSAVLVASVTVAAPLVVVVVGRPAAA